MTTMLINPTDIQLHPEVTDGTVTDSVNVNPKGRVTLPEGFSVTTAYLRRYPQLVVSQSDAPSP